MTFSIYELPVGQGVLALSPMPVNIADVVAWTPDAVLTMTQPAEMPHEMADALRVAAFAWLQCPVVDFGVPFADADWGVIHNQLLTVLSAKGRVLIHCKGGCGRSGMAVLRLMIAMGEAPDAALTRLRHVRPCAVETKAQLAWATAASLP